MAKKGHREMAAGQELQIGATPPAVKRKLTMLEREAAGDTNHPQWSQLVIHRRVVDLLDRGVPLNDIRKCSEQDLEAIDDGTFTIDLVDSFFSESDISDPVLAIVRGQLQSILNRK